MKISVDYNKVYSICNVWLYKYVDFDEFSIFIFGIDWYKLIIEVNDSNYVIVEL